MAESPLDQLWKEYSRAFEDFDNLTLARWLAQTLGQFFLDHYAAIVWEYQDECLEVRPEDIRFQL